MNTKDNKGQGRKLFSKLIKKIAARENNSLEDFYAEYGKLIYISALTMSHSKFYADEIVDDVLVKIWRMASSLTKIKNPNGWLYVITVNCAKDKLKNEKDFSALYDIKISDRGLENVLEEDEFYNNISCLNEQEQEIMIFRFVEDMPFEKIAYEMQKPLSSITSTYYRAIEKIKNKYS